MSFESDLSDDAKRLRTFQGGAIELLRCALSWEPQARLIGNVTAREIATIVARIIHGCPKCGSTAWVNIDCDLCVVCFELVRGDVAPPREG